jgi:hypothetical protein
VVVTFATTMRRQARGHFWFLLGASVLLATIAALPGETSARPRAPRAKPTPIARPPKLPLVRPAGAPPSEAERSAAFMRTSQPIGRTPLFPMAETEGLDSTLMALINGTLSVGSVAISPISYGSIAPPIETPDSALQGAFGFGTVGTMSESQGIDPGVAGLVNGIMSDSTDVSGIGASGQAPSVSQATPAVTQAGCGGDQTATLLQAGGEFWNGQAVSATPAQIPQGVLSVSGLAKMTSAGGNPSDPTLGPSGDRSNLPPLGPAGGWCRPQPVPFSKSSPLASRAVLIPFAVLVLGVIVFWLSRGMKMPGHAQTMSPSYRLRTSAVRRSRPASA